MLIANDELNSLPNMNDEVECPYCDEMVSFDHDDWFWYAEDKNHELQCSKCEKNFIFTTSIIYLYSSEKADCLNDIEHDYKLSKSYPKQFSKMRCTICGCDRRLTDEEMNTLLSDEK